MMNPTDMTSMEAMIYGDDDEDLEAELAAIAGESDAPMPKTSPKKGKLLYTPLALKLTDLLKSCYGLIIALTRIEDMITMETMILYELPIVKIVE